MNIGVIGIGEMGGTLARKWHRKGHRVRVANSRGAAAAQAFANDIGVEAADIAGAVEGAEVVLLAMPFPAAATLPRSLFERAAARVVIIDTANYYPEVRDPHIAEIDAGMPESAWTAQQLGRPIVKAFNSIMFNALAKRGLPAGSPGRLAIPVAGDDAGAKRLVMQLVDEAGFDAVDGGSLQESWRQQPSTPAYCCDYGIEQTQRGLRAAVRGKAEGIRDTAWRRRYSQLFANKPAYAEVHAYVIALNRSLNPL